MGNLVWTNTYISGYININFIQFCLLYYHIFSLGGVSVLIHKIFLENQANVLVAINCLYYLHLNFR